MEIMMVAELLADELAAREWTRFDLADRMGCSLTVVDDLLAGTQRVTDTIATQLSTALGTSALLWSRLDTASIMPTFPPASL